jgi:RND family efflux transporter MFP subunit
VDEPTVEQVQQLMREGQIPSRGSRGSARLPVFLGLTNEPTPAQAAEAQTRLREAGAGAAKPTSQAGPESQEAPKANPRQAAENALAGYPHVGYVDFVSNQVNPATATLTVRGVFANPRPKVGPRVLAPGQFVRVRVAIGPPHPALLVSQAAVGEDQDQRYVYVVNEKNAVDRRTVKVGREYNGLLAITEGLKPDDRVVVDGLQRVKPGVEVSPQVVPMSAGSGAANQE